MADSYYLCYVLPTLEGRLATFDVTNELFVERFNQGNIGVQNTNGTVTIAFTYDINDYFTFDNIRKKLESDTQLVFKVLFKHSIDDSPYEKYLTGQLKHFLTGVKRLKDNTFIEKREDSYMGTSFVWKKLN